MFAMYMYMCVFMMYISSTSCAMCVYTCAYDFETYSKKAISHYSTLQVGLHCPKWSCVVTCVQYVASALFPQLRMGMSLKEHTNLRVGTCILIHMYTQEHKWSTFLHVHTIAYLGIGTKVALGAETPKFPLDNDIHVLRLQINLNFLFVIE